MVLVPVGSSVVDISVDGVTLVAGDEISDDTQYNLSTNYDARIKVNGSQKYYSGAHNQDTTYDVSASASGEPIVLQDNMSGYASKNSNVVDLRGVNWNSNDFDRVEARFRGYLDPSSGGFPTGYVKINGSTKASGSNKTVDTGWVTVNEPGRIRIYHNSNDGYGVSWNAEIAEYRIYPKTTLSINGVSEN